MSLIIRKIQIDFQSCYLIPLSGHYLKDKKNNNTECREGEEDGELLMGMSISAAILENTEGVPQKLQTERLPGLATPLLGMRPKEMTQRIRRHLHAHS